MSPDQNIFLEQLYHENFQYLKGYAFHLINNWDKAEVAVQEAFCIAIEKIDKVMSSDAPRRWMKATVKNTVRNMKKHESYQRSLFVYLEELESLPSTSEALNGISIWELCKQIAGEENFDLFQLTALNGASYLEAAKEKGMSVWACRKRVQRTTQTLREGLKKYFE